KVFAALLDACRGKRLPTKDFEDSYQRVENLRSKRAERFMPLPATPARAEREWADAQSIIKSICDQSATVLKPGRPLEVSGKTLVIFPKVSSVQDRILIETDLRDEIVFFKDRLRPMGTDAAV